MGDILIRNLEDEVVEAWKQRAATNGRSLQAELHEELGKLLKAQRRDDFVRIAREIAASADMSKIEVESWELIREDRDAR